MSLDDNKAEYTIPSCPGITFTTWYDPDNDWLSLEGRDETGMMVTGVGCRMAQAVPTPEAASE